MSPHIGAILLKKIFVPNKKIINKKIRKNQQKQRKGISKKKHIDNNKKGDNGNSTIIAGILKNQRFS